MKVYELWNVTGYSEDEYTLGIFTTEQQAKDYWEAFVADQPSRMRDELRHSISEVSLDPVYESHFEPDKIAYSRQFTNAFNLGDVYWCDRLRRDWEFWWGDKHPWPFGENPEPRPEPEPESDPLKDWERELLGLNDDEENNR